MVKGTKYTVILFHSVDAVYTRPMLWPGSTTDIQQDYACKLAEKVIQAVKRARPGAWTWEDNIEPALEAVGFETPCWVHGPVWDADE